MASWQEAIKSTPINQNLLLNNDVVKVHSWNSILLEFEFENNLKSDKFTTEGQNTSLDTFDLTCVKPC